MAFTFNGIGTKYYGKREEAEDGSFIATEWIVLAYIPIIPIRSFRMRPVSGGTYPVVYASQNFQVVPVPLNWRQVRNVYLTVIGCIAAVSAVGAAMSAFST